MTTEVKSSDNPLMPSRNASQSEFRIAIIGCGPRGLYCLQALAAHLAESELADAIRIDIYEPASYPGAGAVYDPTQPAYLRMNFAVKYINAWPDRLCPHDSHSSRQHFDLGHWLSQDRHAHLDEHSFVPRALVGEYLHDCFLQTVEDLRTRADVQLHRSPVSELSQTGSTWRIVAGGGTLPADEVAITIGHGGWRPPAGLQKAADLHWRSVFPVVEHLNETNIPPNAQVAIRGFGLTAIDAMLALTEGRGGVFASDGARFEYRPSGREPNVIYPFSRTGRPMLAKPDEATFPQPQSLETIWASGRATIANIPLPCGAEHFQQQLWQTVVASAAAALNELPTGQPDNFTASDVHAWFEEWQQTIATPEAARQWMCTSYAVATGTVPPDIAWALGAAWRKLYPAIVETVSHGGLQPNAWPEFRRIAVEMERIAFGPPAENVARILALIEAGFVDLQHIARSHDALQRDFCFVNAVLPAPTDSSNLGFLQQLHDEQRIEYSQAARGITVDTSGRPLVNGTATPGLAIFGRPTEGCVLGNDTLSRSLHRHPEHWAADVLARLSARTDQ